MSEIGASLEERARPTLWRTCRAMANTTRLRILRQLMRGPEQSVSELAAALGISDVVATRHLRRLGARGLLRVRRQGSWVFYRVEADPTIREAGPLVGALRETLQGERDVFDEVSRLATAFTHPRRQAIYEALRVGDRSFLELQEETGISERALARHLDKLVDRGFVVAGMDLYRATRPPGRLAQVLAELAPESAR